MTPDALHAHALGILLDEPIPVDHAAIRTAQRAAFTAALGTTRAQDRRQLIDWWLAERDAKDAAELRACDMNKAAQRWCAEAGGQHARADYWRLVAICTAIAAAGWILRSLTR